MKLYIKNMACESCKVVVREALSKLKLHAIHVELGIAEIKEDLGDTQIRALNKEINKVGLEIVESKSSILLEEIKRCIIEYVYAVRQPKINFSDYLSKKLAYEYSYLSSVFSELEANTITTYLNSVKIERAKEMMLLENFTLTEIAKKLHYSSLPSFSAQFKKITGVAPSKFKNFKNKKRLTIDQLSPISSVE